MARAKVNVKAKNPRKGMTFDELESAIVHAKGSGFTILGRTRLGWKGQIIEMNFERDL